MSVLVIWLVVRCGGWCAQRRLSILVGLCWLMWMGVRSRGVRWLGRWGVMSRCWLCGVGLFMRRGLWVLVRVGVCCWVGVMGGLVLVWVVCLVMGGLMVVWLVCLVVGGLVLVSVGRWMVCGWLMVVWVLSWVWGRCVWGCVRLV